MNIAYMYILLTFDIVSDVEHSTLATDAPHRVRVLDVTHEQLLAVERPRGVVYDLPWTNKPRPPDPGVTTENRKKIIVNMYRITKELYSTCTYMYMY